MATLRSEDVQVSVLGAGDMFGHLGLINEELRTNSYETASEYRQGKNQSQKQQQPMYEE